MMIRAGKRDEVLASDSMWMCTSCYQCIVRCPRKLPITHIMHGLANYSYRLGLSPKGQTTQQFGALFWNNLVKVGRVNELVLSLGIYFKDGFGQGIKNALAMQSVGLGMLKAKRLNPLEIFGGHSIMDKSGFHAMLKKAREIEDKRKQLG